MKSFFKLSLLTAAIVVTAGCQDETVAATTKVEDAQPIVFQSDDEKAAYAIGASFAQFLSSSIEKPKEIGITLDKDIVMQGIQHGFVGKSQMSEEEIRANLEGLDQRVAEKMNAASAAKSLENKTAGDEFRAEFAQEEGVLTTPSGLLYKVLTPSEGAKPKDTDVVKVHYKGTLIDGTQFDSSYDRGEPTTFPLNRVIPGWTEGVQLMSVGSKYQFIIKPELAYGEQDTPVIPGNSTLVFEVELLDIVADE